MHIGFEETRSLLVEKVLAPIPETESVHEEDPEGANNPPPDYRGECFKQGGAIQDGDKTEETHSFYPGPTIPEPKPRTRFQVVPQTLETVSQSGGCGEERFGSVPNLSPVEKPGSAADSAGKEFVIQTGVKNSNIQV